MKDRFCLGKFFWKESGELTVPLWMKMLFLCAAGIFCIRYSRRKLKQLLDRIETMLLEAEKGELKERTFDESLMSRLEMRMYDFLHRSVLSGKKLSEEEKRIRQLISDISHQTKTPISNILLYSQLLTEEKTAGKSRKDGLGTFLSRESIEMAD